MKNAMKMNRFSACWALGGLLLAAPAQAHLIISEFLANPAGTDSPLEFVELVATRAIDFAVTPYAVVFVNNGSAAANGWIAGGSVTYGFSLTTGSVAEGDVVYVGGSDMAPTGVKLRTIATGTTGGDRFGNANASGVLGNGGANADGIGVFNMGIDTLTAASVPVDAVFYGTGAGTAVVGGGAEGYQLPVNDLYNGGKLQTGSFLAPDPTSGSGIAATGQFDPSSSAWVGQRTFAVGTLTDGSTAIALVPEPRGLFLVGLLTLLGWFGLRRRAARPARRD